MHYCVKTTDPFHCCTSLLRNNPSIIHVDNAPGFLSLKQDKSLKHTGITLEYGRIKNVNKNSVIDKAIQELELEGKWVRRCHHRCSNTAGC